MLSAKLLQPLAGGKAFDEKAVDEIIIAADEQELLKVFVDDVWPNIEHTIENGQSENKVVAMQLLYRLLTRLSTLLEVSFAASLVKKLIDKVKDLYCCTICIETLLDCFLLPSNSDNEFQFRS